MPLESRSNRKSGSFLSLKIGVLAGGSSSERKISLRSGRAVRRALQKAGFKTLWIDPKNSSKTKRQLKNIDLAFIALHGHGGEDGVIQHQLELGGISYIGSDAKSSRIAFDKELSKKVFLRSGVPTAPFWMIHSGNWKKCLAGLKPPLFIKPPKEGSSIGAFAVEDFSAMAVSINRKLKEFGSLLVEKKIVGREFTVGILGEKALPVVELKPKSPFYDYKAKYTKGMTEYIVPAKIKKNLARKLQQISLKAHKVLGLRDFSRVDIMVDRQNRPYVLEVNTIPGFTEFSLLPKAARAAGISFEALCVQLAERAYQRSEFF